MNYTAIATLAVVSSVFIVSPAVSKMAEMCSGDHLSKMTTMVGGMPDGPHKSEMNKHLEVLNSAMAKDGIRGCEKVMHQHHHAMQHMRHEHKM